MDLSLELGFHMTIAWRFRLLRMNAPEMVGKTRVAGEQSKRALTDLLVGRYPLIVQSVKGDVFGRWLADIWLPSGVNVSDYMVENGFAERKEYMPKPGAKPGGVPSHNVPGTKLPHPLSPTKKGKKKAVKKSGNKTSRGY